MRLNYERSRIQKAYTNELIFAPSEELAEVCQGPVDWGVMGRRNQAFEALCRLGAGVGMDFGGFAGVALVVGGVGASGLMRYSAFRSPSQRSASRRVNLFRLFATIKIP